MLNYDEEQKLKLLSEQQLAEIPRTEEEIEYWFSTIPKRRKWKAAQAQEWRVRLARTGAAENRAFFLQPFIDKKPSRVDFNTAHVAAVLGTADAFALAKKRKADFSSVWLKGNVMCIAAELGHVEFIQRMLEDGCPYEIVETTGNFAARLSPLRFAVAGGHTDVVELLKEHAIPEDLAEAIRVGNLEALAALKDHTEMPEGFSCKDEATALAVLENFPDVSPSNLTCGQPYGADLAKAIVARHPKLDASGVLPHLARMNLQGLKVLFDACANLKKKVTHRGSKTTLANVAMNGNKVEILRELVDRGLKPTGIKMALKSQSIYDEMLTYLTELDGSPSGADFFANPYAEGFKGRFEDPIFGVELGKKLSASNKGLKKTLDLHLKAGVVEGFSFSSYMISGDGWGVISSELDKRFSSRGIDGERYRVWSGDGQNVKLVRNSDEAGTKITLTVTQGGADKRAKAAITDELVRELRDQFASMFSELEQVSVEHDKGKITFSGHLSRSEAGVVITWPTSPLVDGAFESAFVDAVLSEIRDSQDVVDD